MGYLLRTVERARPFKWRWALHDGTAEGRTLLASGSAMTMGGAHTRLERAVAKRPATAG